MPRANGIAQCEDRHDAQSRATDIQTIRNGGKAWQIARVLEREEIVSRITFDARRHSGTKKSCVC